MSGIPVKPVNLARREGLTELIAKVRGLFILVFAEAGMHWFTNQQMRKNRNEFERVFS